MRNIFFAIIIFTVCWGQDSNNWQELPNAPIAPSELKKHDDLFFRNDTTGWLITRSGQIFHTSDGGSSWIEQLHDTTAYMRCVGFMDDLHGIAGNLLADSLRNVLYKTHNAGLTWEVVDTSTITGEIPYGLCGLSAVDSLTIFGCGRHHGPAYFVRSFDGGESWESFNMSDSVGALIDLYFWDQNRGIMIGGTDEHSDDSHMLVLYTENSGDSWETVYVGERAMEWGWKISFPSESIGYISIQKKPYSDATTEYFLKTTDGGLTWFELPFMFADTSEKNVYSSQAIGFITPTRGWMGSYINDRPTLMTEDGGVSWTEASFGQNVNRIRFVNHWLGYASGRTVYKYVDSTAMNINTHSILPNQISLSQNYPNPFNPRTVIPFELLKDSFVKIDIIDIKGRTIQSLSNGMQSSGNHHVIWNGRDNRGKTVSSGTYFCRLITDESSITRKILLVR
ncbi:MAG TPA: T9SS type A sorting domain-containing protein [Candidatus Marinimicrobia bacterium]|nr:T9SS type A sorting domain-containing protein [Candidatus Neomarinimicrobiota bacterium]